MAKIIAMNGIVALLSKEDFAGYKGIIGKGTRILSTKQRTQIKHQDQIR